MERVVVAAEAEDERLLETGLVLHGPVRLARRGRLALRRAGDDLGEFAPGGFGADVKGGALESLSPAIRVSKEGNAYVEPGIWHLLRVEEQVLRSEDDAALWTKSCQPMIIPECKTDVLFSTMPTYLVVHVQPSPLTSGRSFKISIDCEP
jgi:hypothetical protein